MHHKQREASDYKGLSQTEEREEPSTANRVNNPRSTLDEFYNRAESRIGGGCTNSWTLKLRRNPLNVVEKLYCWNNHDHRVPRSILARTKTRENAEFTRFTPVIDARALLCPAKLAGKRGREGKTVKTERLAIEIRANLFGNWSFNYFSSRPACGSVFSSSRLPFHPRFVRPNPSLSRFLSFVGNRPPFRLICFGFYAIIAAPFSSPLLSLSSRFFSTIANEFSPLCIKVRSLYHHRAFISRNFIVFGNFTFPLYTYSLRPRTRYSRRSRAIVCAIKFQISRFFFSPSLCQITRPSYVCARNNPLNISIDLLGYILSFLISRDSESKGD